MDLAATELGAIKACTTEEEGKPSTLAHSINIAGDGALSEGNKHFHPIHRG